MSLFYQTWYSKNAMMNFNVTNVFSIYHQLFNLTNIFTVGSFCKDAFRVILAQELPLLPSEFSAKHMSVKLMLFLEVL